MNSECYKKTGVQFYIKVETKKVKNGDVVPLSTGHNLKGETTYHFSTGDKEHIDYTVVDNYYVTYKFSEKKRTLKIKKSNGKTETVTFGDTDVFTPVYLQ